MNIFWLVIPVAYALQILSLIIVAIAKEGEASLHPLFLTYQSFACLLVSLFSIFCIYMYMR